MVTLTEYEHQIPDRGASAVLGIWCSIPDSVTTEVDASHLLTRGLPSSFSNTKPERMSPMAANEDYAPSKAMVNAVVQSAEKLEGAAKLIAMLEDKADIEQITPAELAAVRSIVETCAADLDEAWKEV